MMVLLFLSLTLILTSCGGGGGSRSASGPPFIVAELNSFPTGSVPPGLVPSGFNSNASVFVIDDNSGAPINNASVTMNGVLLTYNVTNQDYEGNIAVAPTDNVTLSVAVAGNIYTASGTQFASYPAISAPVSGATWPTRCATSITWSGGSQATNAYYGLGVLDASNPNGQFIWPSNGYLQYVQMGRNSYSIAAGSLTAGNRFAIIGISTDEPISNAAPGSSLSIGGFNYVPFSVSDADTLLNIAVNPSYLILAKGSTQQFTATGTYCSNGTIDTQDLTASITWTSNPDIATVSNVSGLQGEVTSTGSGTTAITATSGNISGSASLQVTNWTLQKSNTPNHLNSVTWSGKQYVAVGFIGTILTSKDGITWTVQNSGTLTTLYSVAWSGAQFIAVGEGGVILSSPDGVSWTSLSSGTVNRLSSVIWAGTKFVAVGYPGVILTSPDGITWTMQNSGTLNPLDSVTWSGAQFVAVGYPGIILSSPDGVKWTSQNSGTQFPLNSIIWDGSQFIAVGDDVPLTSPDGVTWTREVSGAPYAPYGMNSIVWSGAQFASAGGFGDVFTSADGITWTSEFSGSDNLLQSICWSGTQFAVVGWNGTVLTFP
jgi:hypothetical protein